MELTQVLRDEIDAMNYEQMLRKWRFAPSGDPMFQGEVGKYFEKRMMYLRTHGADYVATSKKIGWGN